MTLRAYVTLTCAIAIAVITALFYFEANYFLGTRFNEIEKINRRSISVFSNTTIKAKRYLLSAYHESVRNYPDLPKVFVLSHAMGSLNDLSKKIAEIKRHTDAEIVDIIHLRFGKSSFGNDFPKKDVQLLIKAGKEKASGVITSKVREKAALLCYSPFYLFDEPVGVLVFGYYLGSIEKEISLSVDSKVKLEPLESKDGAINITIENEAIESGNKITKATVLGIGALSVMLVTFIIYGLLSFGFMRGFRKIVAFVRKSSADLDRGIITDPEVEASRISEINDLSNSFNAYSRSLKSFSKRVEEKTRAETIGIAASQMSHDIGGAISTLEIKLDLDAKDRGFREDEKALTRGLFSQMRAISSNLSGKIHRKSLQAKDSGALSSEDFTIEPLFPLVQGVLEEKELEHKRVGITFINGSEKDAFSLSAKIQRVEFKRVLGNLINNAVEAIKDSGSVIVKVKSEKDKVVVEVTDSGCGIPTPLIPLLGTKGFTYGKEDGTGRGLWHAKEIITSWKGNVSFSSIEKEGTTASVILPRVPSPAWCVSDLTIREKEAIIVLDDNPKVHELWQKVIPEREIYFFQKADELLEWWVAFKNNSSKKCLFLIDFEVHGEIWTGIDVISELHEEKSSVLVTGHYESSEVREKCEEHGIKLMPKSLIRLIPIKIKRRVKRFGKKAG